MTTNNTATITGIKSNLAFSSTKATSQSFQTIPKGPRDKWSFITHFAGAILAVAATLYLIITNFTTSIDGLGRLISVTLYGLSMIALYSCSSIYHYCKGPAEKIKKLRKLDHAMIYVLIAGTYTPVLYNGLEHPKSTIFLIGIWSFMVIGVAVKMFWLNAPRWLYTSVYVIMGWAIVLDPIALISLPFDFLMLLLAGGISYTVGAVFYIIKKPNFSAAFGFHEIFHCFIVLGTALQFIGVAFFL